ncbi:MAG: hypothetical protein LBH92_00445 [Bacteroidales bacterium]|nr:hypothetical protein [Bacteroidales bacterium]
MKKHAITLAIGLLLAMNVSTVEAQKPYKMGIGATVGSFQGASFKMFLTDNLAFQADLGFKFGSYRYEYYRNVYTFSNFWTIEVNPNLVYEGLIKDWNVGGLHWFAGGGISFGYSLTNIYISYLDQGSPSLKFGVNAMGGVEFAFKKIPLTTQIDFRPGYGLLFGDGSKSLFEYSINAGVRYTF